MEVGRCKLYVGYWLKQKELLDKLTVGVIYGVRVVEEGTARWVSDGFREISPLHKRLSTY